METQSNNKMPLCTKEGKTALICWNEREEKIDDIKFYRYDYVRVKYPYTYATIVSAIVKSEYSDDQMQAIVNNYLLSKNSDDDSEHTLEFIKMQEWRNKAKEVAKDVMKIGY